MFTWIASSVTTQIPLILEVFARGGGGGSSSGSSGSGLGGALFLVGLIGYIPAHFITALLRKHFIKTPEWLVVQVVSWVIAIASAIALIVISFTIGSLTADIYFFWPIAVGVPLGAASGLYAWYSKIQQPKHVADGLTKAAQADAIWNETAITDYAKQVFLRYQYDWSNFDYVSVANYTTSHYYSHSTLMLKALEWMKRRNTMSNVVVDQIGVIDMYDAADDRDDRVTVGITAHATDQLIDMRDNTLLFTDNNQFTEYWEFQRDGSQWRLAQIRQATENAMLFSGALRTFAAANNMYYSADWGWLLLPRDGELFSGGKFGTSDINNHVIGLMNDMIVQIYTYSKNPAANNGDEYLVAQTSVPRSYGRILVRRRGLINLTPKGLDKISMEWSQFNDKYDVFASTGEGATSFELLHPVFMEQLEALPFKVSMEVVDNVVYLYAKAKTDPNYYAMMLELLQKAHKEMKL